MSFSAYFGSLLPNKTRPLLPCKINTSTAFFEGLHTLTEADFVSSVSRRSITWCEYSLAGMGKNKGWAEAAAVKKEWLVYIMYFVLLHCEAREFRILNTYTPCGLLLGTTFHTEVMCTQPCSIAKTWKRTPSWANIFNNGKTLCKNIKKILTYFYSNTTINSIALKFLTGKILS